MQNFIIGDLDIGNPESLNEHDLNIIKEEGYVEILGHCDDIPKLYHRSHIVCLPSYREGLPKSLIEAAQQVECSNHGCSWMS